MCGIFGCIANSHTTISAASVASELFEMLGLRGPDYRGYAAYSTSGKLLGTECQPPSADEHTALLLGQTRLAILDLTPAGRQPMRTSCGRYSLVFNGEIYNFKELRLELEAQGIVFHTRTDTEVLLQSLIVWGESCLTRLNGMFAFAFFDAERRQLFCARDFFGIKPFFWTRPFHNGFAFASELPALLRFPGVERRVDHKLLYNYLIGARVDVGSDCLLEGVYHLPPAHCAYIDLDNPANVVVKRYWTLPLPAPQSISFSDAVERFRSLFIDSVQKHLRSDVPLGVALSGGLDSSGIACAIKLLEPDMPLHTFSYISADSPALSEEKWVDIVANHIHAVTHKTVVTPEGLVNDIDKLILRQGEPFGSTSIYAQYCVFRLVREHGVVVTLDGQGADEMMAGYVGYAYSRIATLTKKKEFLKALSFAWQAGGWPGRDRANLLCHIMPAQLASVASRVLRVLRLRKPSSALPHAGWLNRDYIQALGDNPCVERNAGGIYNSEDMLRNILAEHTTWENLPNLLRHGDRNSMSFSVESRVPFCSKELVEFIFSLPEEFLLGPKGDAKRIFRAAMRDLIPSAIVDRRDKIGFATPEEKWLGQMSPWVEETLNLANNSSIIDHNGAKQEWDAVQKGKAPFGWHIWRQINYLRWKDLLQISE